MNIPEEFSYKHQCRGFNFNLSMQGPLEKDFNRISTRSSHKDLCQIMQGHREDFTRKNAAPKSRRRLCASRRSRNMSKSTWTRKMPGTSWDQRWPERVPWSNNPSLASLNSYRKNPLVWTHCLGKKCSNIFKCSGCGSLPFSPWTLVTLKEVNNAMCLFSPLLLHLSISRKFDF